MMLRPATPLTVLLFCAFVLLLISVLSTPVVKGIPLAKYQDASFGIFGYCSDSKGCSGIKVGYTTDGLFDGTNTDGNFNLPSSARHSLSSLLIVHPIAAFFCLVMTLLAGAAHFHSPSHSPRYLLALLILTLPTFLITLLAFLVDVLLFIPHLSWGGWIVLASTILIVASGIMLCAMRRTLVSRKARKKRIAENAEMSGENFYNRQRADDVKLLAVPTVVSESKQPLVNGAPGSDSLPAHAAYRTPTQYSDERQSNSALPTPVSPISDENRFYGAPVRTDSRPSPQEASSMPSGRYDDTPMQAQHMPPPNMQSNYPPNGWGRGRGYGPPRGRGGPRGGYGPPPRGGYRGPPPQGYGGRGGYGPDMRGGYPGGRGGSPLAGAMSRRPPPGYPPPHQGSNPDGPMIYDTVTQPNRGQPPPDGTYLPYNGGRSGSGKGRASPYEERRHSEDGLPRAESPPPEIPLIGHAVEMDATTGRASGYDAEVQGTGQIQGEQGPGSPTTRQTQPAYAPPRADWNNNNNNPNGPPQSRNRPRGTSAVSDNSQYYEDVDPRFAETENTQMPTQHEHAEGDVLQPPNFPHSNPDSNNLLPHTGSYENIPAGARSPATSEQSAFTSISQRPINPHWKPGHGGEFNQFGPPPPARRNNQSQVKQDMLLANNPDFELPGMGPPRGTRPAGRGGMRGVPTGGVSRVPLPPSALGLGGDGRYPDPVQTVRDV